MQSSKHLVLINAEILEGSLQAAAELNIEVSGVASECGIDPRLLSSPSGFIAYQTLNRFLETVAARYNCPLFGLLMAKWQPPLPFGLFGQVLKLSPNVGSAIQSALPFVRFYSEGVDWQIQRDAGYALLVRRQRIANLQIGVQAQTLGVTQTFKVMRALCGSGWSPNSVNFSHAALDDKRVYERYFGSPVYFDQEFNGLVFPEADLERTIETADEQLLTLVLSHLESLFSVTPKKEQVSDQVRRHIQQRLGSQNCSIEAVSQLLGLHPRTLQRALSRQRVSFKQLVAQVRQETAVHYLQNSSILLVDLADILGYRNVSAFSRAFKSWYGVPPDLWRKRANEKLKNR